ncbi:MAG: hypothetical protein NT069_08540, partial [Planctomycetota bacterium]|nr:hypothetical protein [Planctomycetota bacterium]
PRRGTAEVPLKWTASAGNNLVWEARAVPHDGAFGTSVDWTKLVVDRQGDQCSSTLVVPAGGWYRIELRSRNGDVVKPVGHVEPVGVGEVFLIAGQSYADGANDELLQVAEPLGRVAALDVVRGTWGVANDPQPNRANGGTLWPHLGDLLVPITQTPIGFVNVAVGGTAIRQWLPGEALYQGLIAGAKGAGAFRCVLWQQGESDVIEKTATALYIERLKTIRAELAKETKSNARWLLAKSTLHPTVYNDPAWEGRIRAAIDSLWREPGFAPGPDTDILNGDNRGGIGTRRHFTGIGQRRAALMWFAAIWRELSSREPPAPVR